jgi:hypothetical protein
MVIFTYLSIYGIPQGKSRIGFKKFGKIGVVFKIQFISNLRNCIF